MDTVLESTNAEFDLDRLMARVRKAATVGEAGAQLLGSQSEEAADANVPGLMEVIAAQAEWNRRTTESLAAVVECLRNLQDGWRDIESRLRREAAHVSALAPRMQRATAARHTGTGKPSRARRRRSIKTGHHRK
jgi:hypothetical protein